MTTPTVPPPGNASAPPPQEEQLEFSPRTKKVLTVVMSAILVAILGGIATFIVVRVMNPAPPAYATGDCVKVVEGGQFAAKVEKIDCGNQGAVYEVGLYMDDPAADCPAESYSSYKQTGGKQQEFKLCLMLNVAEGECLSVPSISMGEEKKVDCASEEANRKVTKVIEGTADETACAADSTEDARVYPDPKRTLCLGPVAA